MADPLLTQLGVGGVFAILVVREFRAYAKEQKTKNGNGSIASPNGIHKTFADDPNLYWERMRQVVTEPLSKVLDDQTKSMNKVLEHIAKEEGRREAEASFRKSAGA